MMMNDLYLYISKQEHFVAIIKMMNGWLQNLVTNY